MEQKITQTRVRRRRLLLYVVVSIWLLLASAWAASYFWSVIRWAPWGKLELQGGVVEAVWWIDSFLFPDGIRMRETHWQFGPASSFVYSYSNYGFCLPRIETGSYGLGAPQGRIVSIPMWVPLVLISLAVWHSWRRLRTLRARETQCVECGYDLAFNTSGTCPECGTAIPTVTTLNGET